MKNDIDDIAKQKDSFLTFTFNQEQDKLLIKAQSQDKFYCGFIELHPLITFDKIKKALTTKNYELVSMNAKKMQITIAGVIDLELKNQDQLNLKFLKDTIQKLTNKVTRVEKELQKNIQLELIVKEIQNEIISIKKIQEQQKTAQKQKNISFQQKIEEVKSQFDLYGNTQKQSIEKIQQEILHLREDIIKQKEVIDDSSQKITLNHQELKEMITVNSEKIQELEVEQSKIKANFEAKKRENDQQSKSELMIVSNIEQEMKKNSKQIETLRNKIDSDDRKQSQSNSQLRELHDEITNKVAEIKNQDVQNKTKLQSIDQEKTQKITNLTAQLTQLRTQFDQLNSLTIHYCLPYAPEFLKQSKVVSTFQEKCIMGNFFSNKKIKLTKLLYRASDNDFCVKKFHEKCDGIGNTLTVVTTELKRKIGGFTPLKWKSTQKDEYVADNLKESFIFSLTYNDKFTLRQPEKAICNYKDWGPRFGGGDLAVKDTSTLKDYGFANICKSYHNQKYKYSDMASFERFHGGAKGYSDLKTVEWQVWGLEFV